MAFPFEPTQLRAQLRAFTLATLDDSLTASRVVRPLVLGLFHNHYNDIYLPGFRPVSPPLPAEIPSETGDAAPTYHKRVKPKKERSQQHGNVDQKQKQNENGQMRKHEQLYWSDQLDFDTDNKPDDDNKSTGNQLRFEQDSRSSVSSTISEEGSDSLVTTIPMEQDKKKRPKDMLINPLTKLFQKNDRSCSDSDSSGHISLGRTLDHSLTETTASSDSKDRNGSMNADQISEMSVATINPPLIDGESNIVAEMEAGSVPNTASSSFASDGRIEDEVEESSSDSAFTDIEGDSMMDVSSIYEYTVPESYVLEEEAKPKYHKQKRGKGKSMLLKNSEPGDSLFPETLKSRLESTPVFRRRPSFTFEKVLQMEPAPTESKLSMLIDLKFRLANVNPLSYYGFVGSDIVDTKRAQIDIFVPPSMVPVLNEVKFASNVAITDCIGYILLSLSKMPDYKDQVDSAWMNPNNWRLELIDEDGELYDSTFGVLGRTRLLSSYNCPNLLALCRVSNPVEISNNNKQSPLPLEFKQNLEYYELKKTTKNAPLLPGLATDSVTEDSIEVKVCNVPDTSNTYISFFVSAKMTVEQLVDHISHLYHVDPSKYRLAELVPNNNKVSTLLIDETEKDEWRPTKDLDALGDLESHKFKFVSLQVRPLTDIRMSYTEAGITPSSSTFTPLGITLGITPPVGTLEGKFQEMAVDLKEKDKQPRKDRVERSENSGKVAIPDLSQKSNFTFGDIIHSNNTLLPTTLNTIYFKWKVYRKKSPILNRIEKALIIDGDYIHLAPTDDTNWKKNPHDILFSQSTTNGNANSHHHHHYLHHYNYSKYYNDSMMKTSSFHITQIIKLKQYKQSKNPNHFKIVIRKDGDTGKEPVKKKYDLEAESVEQCEEIIEKIKWALQVYNMSNGVGG